MDLNDFLAAQCQESVDATTREQQLKTDSKQKIGKDRSKT